MKAYLIPGSGEDLNSRDYSAVLEMYKSQGYEPQFVPIKWKHRTIDSWIEQVRTQISDDELRYSLLSGFSFGSMIALGVASQVNPKNLLLFSLSPYFKEDMPLPRSWEIWAGKRRTENFRKFSFNQIANKIYCPSLVFLGANEKKKYPNMWRRANEAHKRITGCQLVLVDNTGHDVGAPGYVAAIGNALK